MITEPRVLILGATGPVGLAIIGAVLRDGGRPVALSRNEAKLARLAGMHGDEVDTVRADLLADRETVVGLVREADAVVLAAGVDPGSLEMQVSMAQSVLAAAPARLVYVSSCWSYSPIRREVIDEAHPRHPRGTIRHRAEAEDIVAMSGGTVLHVPDFYGPHVHTSPLQRIIATALAGRAVTWPARSNVAREHVYIGDLGRVVSDSISRAPSGHFVVPGSGPISFEEMISLVERNLGTRVRSLALGGLPVGVLRLVDPWSRHLGDAVEEYRKPVRYDGSRLTSHLGLVTTTPYEVGIDETVRWLRDET